MTGLQSRESTTFQGRYYQLTAARCDPKPLQRPHPPICIGGSGEKRTLPTAARYAQHWNFDTGTIAQFTRARDVLHHHCERIGRDPGGILVSCQIPHHGDPAATAANAATFHEAGAELAVIYLPQPYDAAVLEPLAEALAALG
jgi:alkanesulfonate monooxygenase SsuD/methylene tetrahydromethanopterin reductase-like flavin-dependent oxidoreductase (luciferase family)